MAEKFSKFRDPGTGIQVFLTPVAPGGGSGLTASSSPLKLVCIPIFAILGLLRLLLALIFWGIYSGTGATFAIRAVLAMFGIWNLSHEYVTSQKSKRSANRAMQDKETSTPQKGDLIISNHSSWLDFLILACLYPQANFVHPVVEDDPFEAREQEVRTSGTDAKKRGTPRKNAMSANTTIVTPNSASSLSTEPERRVVGFVALSLTQSILRTGLMPITVSQASKEYNLKATKDLDALLSSNRNNGPSIVFPEGTTSNNRALLHFDAGMLPSSWNMLFRSTGRLMIGAGQARIHLISIKHSAPTALNPTTSVYSVPRRFNTPSDSGVWSHALELFFTNAPTRSVQIRQLDRGDSPTGTRSSPAPNASDAGLMDTIATQLSTLARLKKTSLSWNSKKAFLELVAKRS